MALLLSQDPGGVMLDDGLSLWHSSLHITKSFIGTTCRLVDQNCWWCMLMARGLGYYPRLG